MKRLFFLIFLLSACGSTESHEPDDAVDACFLCTESKADRWVATSAEAQGVLDLVNIASRTELDHDVALDVRAANNIVDTRIDLGSFQDLETLDAVPYVGPSAFKRLLNYAKDHGYIQEPGEIVHGISEGSALADAILLTVNQSTFQTLDIDAKLDRRAAQNIVDLRPFDTLTELDAVGYVGASAFEKLAAFAGICETAETDQLIQTINNVSWGDFTRSVRTDVPLAQAIDQNYWPAPMSHAGCFGVRPDDVPNWIPVTAAEDDQRIHNLFRANALTATRFGGVETNVEQALAELSCRTAEREFIGCRFEFEPNPWSGITWNIIESTDGSVRFLFVGTWAE